MNATHSLQSAYIKMGQVFQRLTTLKRLSVLHVGKVVTHLADRYLPLGMELSERDRRLLREEILNAQQTNPEALKQLSDIVDLFVTSEFRSVREFAGHCRSDGFINRRIDGPDFLREEGTATPIESFFACIAGGVCFFMVLGRSLLDYFVWFAFAWVLVLGMPFIAALIAPTTNMDILSHALEQASA